MVILVCVLKSIRLVIRTCCTRANAPTIMPNDETRVSAINSCRLKKLRHKEMSLGRITVTNCMKSLCISFSVLITNETGKGKVKNDRQSNIKHNEKASANTRKVVAEGESLNICSDF